MDDWRPEVDSKQVDFTFDKDTRNQYSEGDSEDHEADEPDDKWSYAATESGDESFKPADIEDEAEEEQVDEGGADDEPPPTEPQVEEGAQDAVEEESSDLENSPWAFQKKRRATGRIAEFLSVESINVTCFDRQMEALIESKVDVIFFQEHKVRTRDVRRLKGLLKAAGWMIHFGPAYEGGKKASAGIGVMWRENSVQIHPERIKDEELAEARGKGMVERYNVDVGWEAAFTVYNIYGESGGFAANVATTEACLHAIRRDMEMGARQPSIVFGDFNATPHKMGPTKSWINDEQWTDLGNRADWWGGVPNRWTCHSRSQAKKSRIDGVIVDAITIASVHDFKFEKKQFFPTHCVLSFELSRNPFREKRTFLQKLGSIKEAIELKWEEITKDMEKKEAVKRRLEEIEKSRSPWTVSSRTVAGNWRMPYLTVISKPSGNYEAHVWKKHIYIYISALELNKKDVAKTRGRGSLKLVERQTSPRPHEDERIRNKWSYEARRCIKQARRCEQLSYRLEILEGMKVPKRLRTVGASSRSDGTAEKGAADQPADDTTEDMYRRLNAQAQKLISKHADKKDQAEQQEVEELERRAQGGGLEVRDVHAIKRLAAKYQAKYSMNKRKSIEDHQKSQMQTFGKKGQGLVDLHRYLRREPAAPLVAVRRKRRGMAKQQKGTIATSVKCLQY